MSDGIGSADCSRRGFLRRFTLGAGAAALFPLFSCDANPGGKGGKYFKSWERSEALPDAEKLGVALVGLGSYATYQLGPALQHTKFCRLTGIVTGTPEKKDQWYRRYAIPEEHAYSYETFDRIVNDPAIDIIYIVLPNGMHAEYTIRAAEAGKHVICEKPMATSVADAEAMVAACRVNNRKLSLGYRLYFEPHHEKVMRLGRDEIFGPVREMRGDFSFRIGENPDVWRLDKELAGGGPLMDVGIYAVQAAIYTVGTLPVAVTAKEETVNRELFSEVEESIAWELEFPGELRAHGASSYSRGANIHHAAASDGWFELEPAYGYSVVRGRMSEGELEFPRVNQQALQMDAFADHILNGAENRVPGEMGLRDTKILYAIYEAAETGKRVALEL